VRFGWSDVADAPFWLYPVALVAFLLAGLGLAWAVGAL
jgi:hypothetical protein